MQVPNLNNINNSNTPQAQNENVAVKKSVQGKYNLVYSTRNPNAGKPQGGILSAIQGISSRLSSSLSSLFVEKGEYRELPNPITLNSGAIYVQTSRSLTFPKFQGIISAGTNVYGLGTNTLSDNDVAIIVDLQLRVYTLEQMLMGNYSSTTHNDISSLNQ